ncbi:MAG: hypothetical protein ABI298_06315 [Acidimicrobiales bacterium]
MHDHTTEDQIVEDYLDDLKKALRYVSPSKSKEFLDGIEQHIIEGRSTLAPNDELGLRNLLERIGSPLALAMEIQESEPPGKASAMDGATPWLLMFGGFVFGAGWFVGLYGLWTSRTWRIWDKLLGSLVWPGGLLGAFYFFTAASNSESCSGSEGAGRTNAVMVCVRHGLVLPAAVQFLAAFLVVVAPAITAFRLKAVLDRGYDDASNPRGIRLAKSWVGARRSVMMTLLVLGLMVAGFFMFVLIA